ncbi:DNA adenine methylase [Peptoniphilus hominis (ex Hitch et al. 2025)]|uniref:site-specific DNA-methyltransferase (adenine-specific) n=1 Tax=Peptoniphilus hominis (ex Hitch et al. 2025) TaxID=3133174 RepID=A0ABV1CBD7_9FIRM
MNYIGSKYSLLDFIHKTISEVTGYRPGDEYVFADLFAGTSVVGASYREKGCKVISNDIQYYSYVISKYFIESSQKIDESIVNDLNALNGVEGFIFNNYCNGSGSGRNYFTDYNGKKCDAIRIEIESLFKNNIISEETYFGLLASLINSIDKYANTASVYGAFLKKIKKSAKKQFYLEILPEISGPKGKVYNKDINELITKVQGDVLYLDPPYNARQYCSNYHVLETIARYDNPVLRGKTGLRHANEQKSKYCSKKTLESEFEYLVENANFKYIFLSYNNEGLMSVEKIRDIMSNYGMYKCFTKSYRRFKADTEKNRNISGSKTTEYIHCLIKEV